MNNLIDTILQRKDFSRDEIIALLNTSGKEMQQLLSSALGTKLKTVGNTVHLRGLIEYSNICRKYCLYCGIRSKNQKVSRYTISDEEVLNCARQALQLGYGSVAIQSGERQDSEFTDKITFLVREIKRISAGKLGITLSCGEQSEEVYREWFLAGAHRYLLRIESSDRKLFSQIHPQDSTHSFDERTAAIDALLRIGYQTGSGVMIGLPGQTDEILADDLLFFKNKNLAMVGMGPFIPHPDTPLWKFRDDIPSPQERMDLTLKMIAILRLMMPEINMVAATADQTIFPDGRERAILAGANVIMPNLTPNSYRENYLIYPDKACVSDTPEKCSGCLDMRMHAIEHVIQYNAWGDSLAFTNKYGISEPQK